MKKILLTTLLLQSIQPLSAIELVRDNKFSKSFSVRDRENGAIILGELKVDNQAVEPVWKLAEWGSESTLFGANGLWIDDNLYRWADRHKAITISPDSSAPFDIQFDMNAYNEFGGSYKNQVEPWPHLLFSQNLYNNSSKSINEYHQVVVKFQAKMSFLKDNIQQGYDSELFAAHTKLNIAIQNRNRNSEGHGDYFHFMIPIYEDRDEMVPIMIRKDSGTDEKPGTGKLMYRISSDSISTQSTHNQKWVDFSGNILPFIKSGLNEAWSRGYLEDSTDLNDYYIGSLRFGHEISGLNTLNTQLKNLSIQEFSDRHPTFQFSSSSDYKGWIVKRMNSIDGGPRNGVWKFRTSSQDPQLISPLLNIEAKDIVKVKLKISNQGNDSNASKLKIFWQRDDQRTWSSSKSKTITISNTGEWSAYTFDFSSHGEWAGEITRIRIDPVLYGNGSRFSFDYINFIDTNGNEGEVAKIIPPELIEFPVE